MPPTGDGWYGEIEMAQERAGRRRVGNLVAILHLAFSLFASLVVLAISFRLRAFFASRGAAEVGDSMQLLLVALALVLWSSAVYTVWKGSKEADR